VVRGFIMLFPQLEVVFAFLQHYYLVTLLFPVEAFLFQLLLQRQLQLLVLNRFSSERHLLLSFQHF